MNPELEEQLELERLIEEQEKDDSNVIYGEKGHEHDVSIDGLENHLVQNEDGEPEVLSPPHPVPSGMGPTGHGAPRGRVKGTILIGSAAYHGTLAGYTKHRCRCERCTIAHRDYKRVQMRNLRARKREATS